MNREVEVRLKFRVDRDEDLAKYFVTVTANVVGRPHDTLQEHMELSDDVIENGFSGKKDVALDLFKKEAINDIIWKLLAELKRKDPTYLHPVVTATFISRNLHYLLCD
jgi:hypothetical protein